MEIINNKTGKKNYPDSLLSGFIELDNLLGKMQSGLYVIGARPGMGKTSFLLNIIVNLIVNKLANNQILFISTNESKKLNLERFTSIITKIPIRVIQNDEINYDKQIKHIDEHPILKKVNSKQLNIYRLNNKPYFEEIYKLLNHSKSNISILMIDCLQDFIKENETSVETQIEYIMESLKVLASEQNIPIIISSHIERTVEKSINKMPTSINLIQNIEKHADVLMFILRPEYYQIIDNNEKTFANISVAKNNFGSIGEFELATEMDKLLFKNQ
jgi:replicative DNA helicase